MSSQQKKWEQLTSKLEVFERVLPWRRTGDDAPPKEDAPEVTPREFVRRVLFYLSAVVAALACAAILTNFVIMPIMVRRGDLAITPDLVGMQLVEAERVAEEHGLNVRVDTERPDPVVSEGGVAVQTPRAGGEIKRGRTVAVILSTGIDLRELPALAGLNARQAQLDAEHAGFAIGEIVEIHTNHVERGRVIGTDPGEGVTLPAGTGIKMLVSLGPKPAELIMPSLIGKTVEEARLIVEDLGLVVRSVKYSSSRQRTAREIVVVQDPVAGAHVVEGEGVTLRVGS